MAEPTPAQVQQVIAACPKCPRQRATNLLKMCGNDPQKAIEKYKTLEGVISVDEQHDSSSSGSTATAEPHDDSKDSSSTQVEEMIPIEPGLPWSPLPRLPDPGELINGGADGSGVFELCELIGAIQAGADPDRVRNYLGHYDEATLQDNLNAKIHGYPAIFYIAETRNDEMIRHWVKFGGDPNGTSDDGLPLLAFIILQGSRTLLKATQTVTALLKYGASPEVIPAAFYKSYGTELPEKGPQDAHLHDVDDENKAWCTPEVRAKLAQSLNLTQRYYIYRAAQTTNHRGRERILLQRQNAEDILSIHQTIIGQSIASRWLTGKLLTYLAMQIAKPLVLVFAGPSGHGKTRLCNSFNDLLSVRMHQVDCAAFSRVVELFGPRKGYEGAANGSALNNFLARESGQRSIVFMDEFERTSKEIYDTLLVPLQEGHYEDRRDLKRVDCRKTIWIMATNALDDTIHAFCKDNAAIIHSEDHVTQDRLVKKLCRELRTEFAGLFGAPLARRVTEIIPFMTFSLYEQIVVAHSDFMEKEAKFAKPVRLSANKDEDNYVGNVKIDVSHDATVFSTIAQENYRPEAGASSIFDGISSTICEPLVAQYLKDGDDFDENQPTTHFVVDIDVDKEVEVRLIPQAELKEEEQEEQEEEVLEE
ncbi:hypothetical protein AB5N19_03733 [Seiridium cardinale]